MEKFTRFKGRAALLDMVNIDTDQIIPKQFLTKTDRDGYGQSLFYDWRYLENGKENPDFELNKSERRNAEILVSGDNFGCGSSREHAPWALAGYGFRVIIAPSFADIFYGNSIKNGLLPAIVSEDDLERIRSSFIENRAIALGADLEKKIIELPDGSEIGFQIADLPRKTMLEGIDQIEQTLACLNDLAAFEKKYRQEHPWCFS